MGETTPSEVIDIKVKDNENENEKVMSAKDRIRTIIDYFEQEIYTHIVSLSKKTPLLMIKGFLFGNWRIGSYSKNPNQH